MALEGQETGCAVHCQLLTELPWWARLLPCRPPWLPIVCVRGSTRHGQLHCVIGSIRLNQAQVQLPQPTSLRGRRPPCCRGISSRSRRARALTEMRNAEGRLARPITCERKVLDRGLLTLALNSRIASLASSSPSCEGRNLFRPGMAA